MINTQALPNPSDKPTFTAEPAKKASVRAAAATENILAWQATKADHSVTVRLCNDCGRGPSEAPQAKGPAERNDRYVMGLHSGRRRHTVFTAEEMHFMSEISQPFGRLEKISFRSAITIKAFVHQANLHTSCLSSQQR